MESIVLLVLGFIVLAFVWSAGAGVVAEKELDTQAKKADLRNAQAEFKANKRYHSMATDDAELLSAKDYRKVSKARSTKSAADILAELN